MAIVADYSAGFPGAANLKAMGFIGAQRYIGFPGNPKCTNAAELASFTGYGLGMALVFEHDVGDWRGGYVAGWNNYLAARGHANAIGFPSTRPIYMAVDSEVVGSANHAQMADYIRGARDAAGSPRLVGVYGQYSVCQYLWQLGGICDWYWQCRAWSGTPVQYFGPRHLFQRVGTVQVGSVPSDINDVAQDDWGQHLITNKEREAMALMQGSGPQVYIVGPSGKRHIANTDELDAYLKSGLTVQKVSDETLNGIDPAGNWNSGLPVEDSDTPSAYRPAHRLIASIYEKAGTPAPVALSPEDRAAIVADLAALIPSAGAVAQAVVAEFKKEGN